MNAVIDHPALGRLTRDDAQRLWRGEVEAAPGRRAIVTVEAERQELDAALAGAARSAKESSTRVLVAGFTSANTRLR